MNNQTSTETDTREGLLKRFRDVENALSPKNLTRDGELTVNEIQREALRLHQMRDEIINALGYEPDFIELYPECSCVHA